MPKRLTAAAALSSAAAAAILCPLSARATVTVEQIEAYEDASAPFTHYAPVDFGGASTKAVASGNFSGITFHALDVTSNTLSNHAAAVGNLIYGTGAPGSGYVTSVYAAAADPFFTNTINGQVGVSNNGPAPGHFDGGAQIINNSYVAHDTSNLDTQRRLDFMINRDDVTFIASATDTGALAGNYLAWSAYNALAVRGDQGGFDPTGSPGKAHVDLGMLGQPSFTAASVSGAAAGLYGHAQAAAQADAQHGIVMRSLLMAGTDKTIYTPTTANHLDVQWGAGQLNYNTSLSILQAGEQPLLGVSGGNVTGSITNNLKGWSFGTVNGGAQSAMIFHASTAIDGLTASLNWNVNQSQPTGTTIDTTNAGTIFPNLALELRPVTFTSGHYVLGASSGDATLHSNATNDNVEYLYSGSILPAGDYAFLITGDAGIASPVGFSYAVVAPTLTQWNSSTGGLWANVAKWTNGVPNSPITRANFLSSPGLTSAGSVTLDGNKTVGQITFNNANSYSIDPGTGGTLTIDDTGDGGGANPLVTVSAGSHSINVPVGLAGGLTVNAASGTSLNISGNLTGSGTLTKSGSGSLTLGGTDSYGDTTINAGILTLGAGGSIAGTTITVISSTFNVNGTLTTTPTFNLGGPSVVNFAGNGGTGSLTRNLTALNVAPGGLVKVQPSAFAGHPEVLNAPSIVLGDTTAKIDLTNNELLTIATLASIRTKIGQNQIFTSTGGGGLGSLDVGGGQTEVRYTLLGDTNIDGKVDVSDLGNLASYYGTSSGALWIQGDTNYDGTVDVTDLGNMASSYGGSLATGPAHGTATAASELAVVTSGSAAVPEPSMLGLCLLAFAGAIRRRRSRA